MEVPLAIVILWFLSIFYATFSTSCISLKYTDGFDERAKQFFQIEGHVTSYYKRREPSLNRYCERLKCLSDAPITYNTREHSFDNGIADGNLC